MDELLSRVTGAQTRYKMALAAGLGALAGLGQTPWGYWPLTLIGLTVLAVLLDSAHSTRRAAWIGWGAGVGYFALVLFWIVEPFMVDIARHGWMAPFAVIGIAAGMALFWALGFGLARWIGGARFAPLALVVTLTGAEMLRTYVLTGFPWGMIAYVWVDTGPMQLASLVGPHGLTALTLLLTGGTYALTALPKPRAALAATALWGAFIGTSAALQPDAIPEQQSDRPIIRLVQPNAPQHLKWDPEMIPVFFRRQLELTSAAGDPDLIVWPETSVPALLERADSLVQTISDTAGPRPVVVGIQRRGETGYHNSLATIGAQGTVVQVYDKHHLVPFGEYVPLGDVAAMFGLSAFAAQEGFGYAPGPGPQLLNLGGDLGRPLPLICYEAIFPQDVSAAPERPGWLLQITNDAWFGQYSGPYQHLAQARFRAVEQGLPLVRAANTGISAVIDGHGRVIDSLPLGEAGYLDVALPHTLVPTPYSYSGDIPLLLLLITCAAMLLMRRHGNTD